MYPLGLQTLENRPRKIVTGFPSSLHPHGPCRLLWHRTQDGTHVDVYDRLSIQKRVAQTGMKFEAAWSPTGAVAISRTRYPEAYAQIQKECPERLKPFPDEALINRDLAKTVPTLQQYAPQALVFNDSFDLRDK
jgi:hypothetical protein